MKSEIDEAALDRAVRIVISRSRVSPREFWRHFCFRPSVANNALPNLSPYAAHLIVDEYHAQRSAACSG